MALGCGFTGVITVYRREYHKKFSYIVGKIIKMKHNCIKKITAIRGAVPLSKAVQKRLMGGTDGCPSGGCYYRWVRISINQCALRGLEGLCIGTLSNGECCF